MAKKTHKIKITKELIKKLHGRKIKSLEQEEVKRLQSMLGILEDKEYQTEREIEHKIYNVLCSKMTKELGISKRKIRDVVRGIKLIKSGKSSYSNRDKIVKIKIPTDSRGNYKINDELMFGITKAIGAELGHAFKGEVLPEDHVQLELDDYYHEYYDRIGKHAAIKALKGKKYEGVKLKDVEKAIDSHYKRVVFLQKLPKTLEVLEDELINSPNDEKSFKKLKQKVEPLRSTLDKINSYLNDLDKLDLDYLGHAKYYALADMMVREYGIKDAYSKSPEELKKIINTHPKLREKYEELEKKISKLHNIHPDTIRLEVKNKLDTVFGFYDVKKSHFERKPKKSLLKDDTASMHVPGSRIFQKIMGKKEGLKAQKLKKGKSDILSIGRTPQSEFSSKGANMTGRVFDKLKRKKKDVEWDNRGGRKSRVIPSKFREEDIHSKVDDLLLHSNVDKIIRQKEQERLREQEKAREKEEIDRLMGMRPRAYDEKYNVPTAEESEKQMKEWERKRKEKKKGKGKEERIPGTGVTAGLVCPECGSNATETTNKPNVIYCPVCKKTYVIKKEVESEGGAIYNTLSDVIHSSMTTIVVSAIIGLFIAFYLGQFFNPLGCMFIGLGIIFMGLSRIGG